MVIRGEIISYSASRNKERKKAQEKLIESIQKTDCQYAKAPTAEVYKEKFSLKTKYDLLSTEKNERDLIFARARFYEHGEKAGRLLAQQLKSKSASRLIPKIRKTSQEITVDPQEINSIFYKYYSDLYSSEFPHDDSFMSTFLANVNLPTVKIDQKNNLDKTLQLQEIEDSIRAMQSGKAPGPDGFPIEFYKKFSLQLSPLLLNMFNHSLDQSKLPSSLTQAHITVLLKPDKNALDCSSYRPISLLNVDVKILSKVLASRIENIIPDIISQDQTGFIKGRHSFINIRKLLNVVHSPASESNPEVVISLDAEKAFDRVEWEYLFAVLDKFGFGSKFISWIRLLYHQPKAAVVTNKITSQYFSLSRGTRQGCPLSPLLFVLAIEPLTSMLRSSQSINGIKRRGIEYKVSLYADDLLLYITDPLSCISQVVNILKDYGYFSGYKLNFSKSICFPINNMADQIIDTDLPFCISKSGFKYLGINITRSYTDLFKANYNPILKKLESDLQRWSVIYLSLAGKINCVKMNVLPRLLYLFQSLPIFLPKSFFQSTNRLISSFIWGGKQPRIRREFLEKPKKDGGLALPNLLNYYWAANLQKIIYWFHSPHIEWCEAEAKSCKLTSLAVLITMKSPFSPSQFSSSPVVISTLKIYNQFRQAFQLTDFSLESPICNNHLFPAANLDATFKQWQGLGIVKCSDFFIDNIFANYNDLIQKCNLQKSDFFRYLQVRHFIQAHCSVFPQMPSESRLDLVLKTPTHLKGLISKIYNLIMTFQNISLEKIKTEWTGELGIDISEDIWDKAVERINKTSSCARLNLIQMKVFYRIHYSKTKLAKLYPNIDETCDRCSASKADLTHMFWSCAKLRQFWFSIFDILNSAFNLRIQPNPS